MLAQTNVFRAHGLGSFREMTRAMTVDPAMLVFLNGIDNRRRAVNENYARELMELFTLGADRGAYTETDVRELARALTGWRADWSDAEGLHNFRFDATRWDSGAKTVFGRTGAFDWEDACSLVIEHPLHASFFVAKLWSYFVPTPPPAGVAAALERAYVELGPPDPPGARGDPVLAGALRGPADDQAAGRPARRHAARARARRSPARSGCGSATAPGQRLYHPPDVSGWDDKRWLDSNTIRARWDLVNYAVAGRTINPGSAAGRAYPAETPEQALAAARAFWLDPRLEPETGRVAARLRARSSSRRPTTRAPRSTGASSAPSCARSARTPSVI